MMTPGDEEPPENDEAGHGRRSRHRYRDLDDATLIDAMRSEDPLAIDEFIVRAQRAIYDRAWNSGVSREACEDCAVDVIDDVALLIVTGKVRPSRSIASYLMKVFRTRIAKRAREERDRATREREAEAAESDARRLAALSEDAWRSSHAFSDESTVPVAPALARLAALMADEITAEEHKILEWLSNYVSQRDICQWLGVSYAAGTQRLWRLRERLKRAALARASEFTPDERYEVNHFLRWAVEGRHTAAGQPRPRNIRGGTQ